jgi:hypothetical protein
LDDGAVDKLTIKELLPDTPAAVRVEKLFEATLLPVIDNTQQSPAEVAGQAASEAARASIAASQAASEAAVEEQLRAVDGADEADEASVDADEEDEQGPYVLYPRSMKFFYNKLLKNLGLQRRPPHDACDRCAQYDKNEARTYELQAAVRCKASDVDHSKHAKVLEDAGGLQAARAELRSLEHEHGDLKKHVEWRELRRAYCMMRHDNLQPGEVMWQLDYGGFQDSGGKKVSVWSVTVLAPGREQEHFDFLFDAANQHSDRPGAKKDGITGMFFLHELLGKR